MSLLEQLREEFGWLQFGVTTILVDANQNATWWTFSGAVFNAAMADALGDQADKVSHDNLAISFSKVLDSTELKSRIRQLLEEGRESIQVPLDAKFIQELKFSECMPQEMIDQEVCGRYSCERQLKSVSEQRVLILNILTRRIHHSASNYS